MSGLLSLLIVIAIIGAIAYLIVNVIPMPPQFRTIIIVVACLVVLLALLNGGLGGLSLGHLGCAR